MSVAYTTSSTPVLVLFFILIGLLLMLFFLYRKLNRESEGQYTIRRMVYKEGGLRDRTRGAALALGSLLRVRLWPRSETHEEGEEMQEVQDEGGNVEEGGGQGSDGEEGKEEEDEQDEYSDAEQRRKGDDTSNDASCLEGSEAGEQARLIDESEAKETEEKEGEKEEKAGEGQGKGEASGGPGLLIDLKQFSGSAIWSEEQGTEGKDVTAL